MRTTEDHDSQQPLREVEAVGPPEVSPVDVRRDGLPLFERIWLSVLTKRMNDEMYTFSRVPAGKSARFAELQGR